MSRLVRQTPLRIRALNNKIMQAMLTVTGSKTLVAIARFILLLTPAFLQHLTSKSLVIVHDSSLYAMKTEGREKLINAVGECGCTRTSPSIGNQCSVSCDIRCHSPRPGSQDWSIAAVRDAVLRDQPATTIPCAGTFVHVLKSNRHRDACEDHLLNLQCQVRCSRFCKNTLWRQPDIEIGLYASYELHCNE